MGSGCLDLVDLIFVETHSVQPSKAEEEPHRDDQQEHNDLILLDKPYHFSIFFHATGSGLQAAEQIGGSDLSDWSMPRLVSNVGNRGGFPHYLLHTHACPRPR